MPFSKEMYEENKVYKSWIDNPFRFVNASNSDNEVGLRKPQLAALYIALGHLASAPTEPATVVMPTGTGKTDTIFSLIIAGAFPRTLILVPSDALREQTAEKFLELRNLRHMQAISPSVIAPNIRKVSSRLDGKDMVGLHAANVIIATPQALQQFSDDDLQQLASICTHLVVDEAHHVAATTWNRVRQVFEKGPCIQFTATPFREDKESLGGRIIYNYPLKDAQLDGYFQQIEFHPIREYQPSQSDRAIARKAVELLRQDLADGRDHLMMVRANSQIKAEKLFEIYSQYADLKPVLVHSKVKGASKILEDIKGKKYKIIVCVDMLGEGFDLPELKIAAIHDQHRTPAITLQFIGRMTRANKNLGAAKFVANIANQKMDTQIAALYEESADWWAVIREVSSQKIQREIDREELVAQFEGDEYGEKILALNPQPKVSAVAFHVRELDWHPENAKDFSSSREQLRFVSVNESNDLVMLVTRAEIPVAWADTSEINNVAWFLYMAYYVRQDKTVFVNCSGDERQLSDFVKLIASNSKRISGEPTFRVLHDVNFIKLQNVGLSRAHQDVRFTMHVGRDINAVMNALENGTAVKSNIFATGFESGMKTSAGCSHKGKLWEMNTDSIDYWVRWCERTSSKINNQNIDVKDILDNVMLAEKISEKWPKGLFYADWPEEMLIENEIKTYITIGGASYSLLNLSLGEPVIKSDTLIEIAVLLDGDAPNSERRELFKIGISLLDDGFFTSCSDAEISVRGGTKLSEYLNENPIRILKEDGSFLRGNYRYYSRSTLNVKIPRALLTIWDWGNTKIQKESMGKDKDMNTVQGFTYSKIADKYQIIFNDDGSGEIADLVGINEKDGIIYVDFYHCKYCPSKDGQAKPGSRVTDTYEVSGQTSRSVKWLHSAQSLFSQLIDRYGKAKDSGFDRILKGDISQIDLLRHKSRDQQMKIGFNIVQPAISYDVISDEQLTVLGTTYTYIKGISGTDLKVIISK